MLPTFVSFCILTTGYARKANTHSSAIVSPNGGVFVQGVTRRSARSKSDPDEVEIEKGHNEFFRGKLDKMELDRSLRDVHSRFQTFLNANHRHYHHSRNVSEYVTRLQHFANTMAKIEERNKAEKNSTHKFPATHGVTKFADWSIDEVKAVLGYRGSGASASTGASLISTSGLLSRPSCSKVWKSRSFIRNQGQCGDCWAFSTVETIRATYMAQNNGSDPGKLSTQYLVDCLSSTRCQGAVNGCCGGDPYQAMEWIMGQGGVPSQDAYGDIYISGSGSLLQGGPVSHTANGITYSGNHPDQEFPCKTNIPKSVTLTEGPKRLTSEAEMSEYTCNSGVISIAVDASAWQTYTGGVMSASTCGTSLDHAVTIVGVNEAGNYWIVQNSWGEDWGVSSDGAVVPRDEYSNCPSLAQEYGCSVLITGGVKLSSVCKLSCHEGDDRVSGGYVLLAFGENTCGIAQDAVVPRGLKAEAGFTEHGHTASPTTSPTTSRATPSPTMPSPTTTSQITSATTTSTMTSFDCKAGLDRWRRGWSAAKKIWCCEHESNGCESFNCNGCLEEAAAGWSEAKKEWCCLREGKGCDADDN